VNKNFRGDIAYCVIKQGANFHDKVDIQNYTIGKERQDDGVTYYSITPKNESEENQRKNLSESNDFVSKKDTVSLFQDLVGLKFFIHLIQKILLKMEIDHQKELI
jgi:hypothetical protein